MACSAPLYADQVTLKNGDMLTGKVIAKRENTLVFSTPYAGELKIAWSEVQALKTDQPVDVLLRDQTQISTALTVPTPPPPVTEPKSEAEEGAEGKPEAAAPPPAPPSGNVTLNDILYINPTPEESGRGYRTSGRANLAFVNTTGNSVTSELHVNGEVSWRAKTHRFTLGAEANHASVNNIENVDNKRTYTSYDRFLNAKDFLFAHAALENDQYKDVRLRKVLGVGYGYQVFDTEKMQLSLRAGPDLVSLNRYVAPSESFTAFGWHVDFKYRLPIAQAQLFHVQDGYRGFNSGGDILLQTRTGLMIPLMRGLNITTQVNGDWESNPSPGRKRTDTKVLFGIGYVYN